MASVTLTTLALLSTSVCAFQNTSPFFLISTVPNILAPPETEGPWLTTNPALDTAASIDFQLANYIRPERCAPKAARENYIMVQQEGVLASDFVDRSAAPHLSQWLSGSDERVKQALVVPEVLGQVDANGQGLHKWINLRCGGSHVELDGDKKLVHDADAAYPRVYSIKFPALSASDSASKLAEYDQILADFITTHLANEDWTVFYTTGPRDVVAEELVSETYEMDEPFPGAINMELKRDVLDHTNEKYNEVGLFEKYMFFTPGIFMGFVAILPLFAVLYVGVSAISGLEVSYFAFSREMGPAGQKKSG